MRVFVPVAFVSSLLASTPQTVVAHFPDTGIRAAKVDAAGNIFIAGFKGTSPETYDAFVAKLSPDGSKVLYSTTLAGSKSDYVTALALDASGAAYIVGETQSSDFPVTPGAAQARFLSTSNQGFVAKVDPQGNVVYATFIGGSSDISLGAGGLVVDSSGEAIVSGQTIGGDFPVTPSAPFSSPDINTFFVLKLDARGARLVGAVRGLGGRVALDSQSNIYVAGVVFGNRAAIPITPRAFQNEFELHLCSGTGQFSFWCEYQYVAKLNSALTGILYSTFVTGSYGAAPAAILVDPQNNAVVTGTTNSPDYPTTSDSFQPVYVANAMFAPENCLSGCITPPPSSGYLTKLNATGTGLVSSTFFSGTNWDSIRFAVPAGGGVYLTGEAGSADLPGLQGVPAPCLPETFVTRMSLDGSSVTAARIARGTVLAYDAGTGTMLAWTGVDLVRFDPASSPPPIACILDAADLRPVTQIAPGELLAIFGPHFTGSVYTPDNTESFPRSLGGVSIAFNGVASPLLYVSPEQINVQAPFEIADAETAAITLVLADTSLSESRTLPVVASQPTIFLDTMRPSESSDLDKCQPALGGPLVVPLAFNSDGSRNSCVNPASAGSTVRLFLSGLGVIGEAGTGAINPSPGAPLTVPISTNVPEVAVIGANAATNSISGVWQVDLKVTGRSGPIAVSFFVEIAPETRIPVRDTNLTVWVQ